MSSSDFDIVSEYVIGNEEFAYLYFRSFPSQYIGRLTGIMWTIVGAVTFIQFALIKLTVDINRAWRVRLFSFG